MNKLFDCNVKINHEMTVTALYQTQYADGPMAILAEFTFSDGQIERHPISVNLPQSTELKHGEFFLKSWSELEQVADKLVGSGILVVTGEFAQTGYAIAPVVTIKNPLDKPEQ